MSKESRKQLAKLPFSEKLKILAKLRDRSLAIAAACRKQAQAKHDDSDGWRTFAHERSRHTSLYNPASLR